MSTRDRFTLGMLRYVVTLKRRVGVVNPDTGGIIDQPAEDVAELPAAIRPGAGREQLLTDLGIVNQEAIAVAVKFDPRVSVGMYLAWDDAARSQPRAFEILAIKDLDERHRWLDLTCVERVS